MPASTKGEPVGDRRGDAFHRLRAHRVAVHKYRLAVAGGESRCKPLRKRNRVARRQDRQNEIGRRDLLIAAGNHPRGLRPQSGFFRAALQRREHLEAMIDQTLAHGGAHHAWRDDRNDRVHHTLSAT